MQAQDSNDIEVDQACIGYTIINTIKVGRGVLPLREGPNLGKYFLLCPLLPIPRSTAWGPLPRGVPV